MWTHLPEKEGTQTQFSAHVCCGQTAGWIKIPLGSKVDLRRDHIMLDGDPVPPPKRSTAPPHFSAHVCCDQTAGWIKMSLGTKVGLGPGHIVLHGIQLPQKGHSPQFSAHVYCGQTVARLSYGGALVPT